MITVKEEAKKLIDNLPDEITWDDLMYEIYVRQKIEKGLKDIEEGKTVSFEEAKRRLLS
jgi:predicted transcriptional regulator